MPVCDVAHHYVEYIQERRYDAVGDLWAEDAVFHTPAGTILHGQAAIRAFYARFLKTITPELQAASFVADETSRVCVMELKTRMSRDAQGRWTTDSKAPYSLSAIDRMTIAPDGRIQAMTVYLAPDNRWTEEQK